MTLKKSLTKTLSLFILFMTAMALLVVMVVTFPIDFLLILLFNKHFFIGRIGEGLETIYMMMQIINKR